MEIWYFSRYFKFEMWPALFYVNPFIFNSETQIGE